MIIWAEGLKLNPLTCLKDKFKFNFFWISTGIESSIVLSEGCGILVGVSWGGSSGFSHWYGELDLRDAIVKSSFNPCLIICNSITM